MLKTLVAVATLIVLVGCGSESEPTAAEPSGGAPSTKVNPPTSSAVPTCDDVWQDGKTIPEDYEGCLADGGDTLEAAVTQECDSGIGTFITYDDKFYALLGKTITAYDGDDDTGYAAAYEECFADK